MALNVTIAGAGIAGLALGLGLAKDGHRVRIAERAPDISEVGAGLQISPNGMAVLDALGLGDALAQVSIRATAVRLIDGPSGRKVTDLDLQNHADDLTWRFVHRAKFIALLLDAAKAAGVSLETGRDITPSKNGAPLDGDDLLIGADGLHSKMRAGLNPASKPFFTRQVAWRAVVPDRNVAPRVEVHMGPRRHLVTYPLADDLRNIVAVEERTQWADEGWAIEDDPAHLRAAFAGFAPPVQDWLGAVDRVHLWGLFRHPVADRWSSGAQVLVGDAAHPTLPFLAQGANLALEDAWGLIRVLRAYDLPEALERYQILRAPRARRVVDAATKNARNYHLSFPPLRFAAHSALRFGGAIAPARMVAQFDWLYRHDVTTEVI